MMGELRTRVIREVSFESSSRKMPEEHPTPNDIYLCGECGTILDRDRSGPNIEHGDLRCPNCGALNDLRSWLPRLGHDMLKLCPSCCRYRRHPGQPVCGSCWWR
jgi:DNA-directed RNA polymerase subunit RPC12/RpoP